MENLSNNFILILMAGLLIKHFICDFPLQNIANNWIINSKGHPDFRVWYWPLAIHSMIHGFFSVLILSILFKVFSSVDFPMYEIVLVGLLETGAHLVIDRIKAHPKLGGRFRPDQIYFWWALGLDQLAHMLTYVLMVAYLVN